MSVSDLLKENSISTDDKELVILLQHFYQEGYMQGVHDKNSNYEYSLKYKEVVERVLGLFRRTINPIGLANLEKALDVMDKYDKEHPSLF